MRSVGDNYVFPSSYHEYKGITYRQWLIGQALASWDKEYFTTKKVYKVLETVDLIIEKLDKEQAADGSGV